mgnify:CR=1 FL=1
MPVPSRIQFNPVEIGCPLLTERTLIECILRPVLLIELILKHPQTSARGRSCLSTPLSLASRRGRRRAERLGEGESRGLWKTHSGTGSSHNLHCKLVVLLQPRPCCCLSSATHRTPAAGDAASSCGHVPFLNRQAHPIVTHLSLPTRASTGGQFSSSYCSSLPWHVVARQQLDLRHTRRGPRVMSLAPPPALRSGATPDGGRSTRRWLPGTSGGSR